jgi:hypothetical protein
MLNWLKKKSEIEILKDRYAELMRQSFRISLHDPQQSERLNKEAKNILQKLRDYQSGHKESILD